MAAGINFNGEYLGASSQYFAAARRQCYYLPNGRRLGYFSSTGEYRPVIVAIHQPNYAPWLGYFHKIFRSDAFVFLDDAQYSRGGYTNRVRIGRAENPVWLTQPIKRDFGGIICETIFSVEDWPARHLDTLKGTYARAAAFKEVWPVIRAIWESVPCETLGLANRHIIEALAEVFGLTPCFISSSTLETGTITGDDRLVCILQAVAPGGSVYLSGEGGANYQSAEKFSDAGYELCYDKFQHPEYQRGEAPFIAGLSILDALFYQGVDTTCRLVRGA